MIKNGKIIFYLWFSVELQSNLCNTPYFYPLNKVWMRDFLQFVLILVLLNYEKFIYSRPGGFPNCRIVMHWYATLDEFGI